MLKKTVLNLCFIVMTSLTVMVCSPASEEAATVYLPVSSAKMASLSCVTDLGWTVDVSSFIVSFSNLEFTVEGETHTATNTLSDWFVPCAIAHPGHYAGGDVTGELVGAWGVDFASDGSVPLGEASLLEGDYNGVNLTFQMAQSAALTSDTKLVSGHTAYIAGRAVKDDLTLLFEAFVDVENGLQVVGGIFELDVTTHVTTPLALAVILAPETSTTFFDGIDFSTLSLDSDGGASILAPTAAHNLLMKALQRHDYWVLAAVE